MKYKNDGFRHPFLYGAGKHLSRRLVAFGILLLFVACVGGVGVVLFVKRPTVVHAQNLPPSSQTGATASSLARIFTVNIPTAFRELATIAALEVEGESIFGGPVRFENETLFDGRITFGGDMIARGYSLDLASGTITASNVIYSMESGDGISISDGQTPTITNTDRGSAQNIFKKFRYGDTTVEAEANDDTFTFAAGAGISLSLDTDDGTLTITNDEQPGIVKDGSYAVLASGVSRLGVGTTTPENTFEVDSGVAGASGFSFTRLNSSSSAGVGGGKVLSVDSGGRIILVEDQVGDSEATAEDILPSATNGMTLYYNGLSWVASNNIFHDGGSVGVSQTNPVSRLHVNTNLASKIGLIVQGYDSQSAHLQEWRNSDGDVLAYVDNNGVFTGSANIEGDFNPGLTTGAILFQGSSGVAGDTSALFWDEEEERLGVGTASPTRKLEVVDGVSKLTFYNSSTTYSYLGITNSTKTVLLGAHQGGNGYLTAPGALKLSAVGVDTWMGNGSLLNMDGGKFVISTAGNVGIGTTNPGSPLTVEGHIRLNSSANAVLDFNGNNLIRNTSGTMTVGNGALNIGSVYTVGASASQSFVRGSTTDLFISSTGNVGIGTTNPGAKLNIQGTADDQLFVLQANSTQTTNLVEWKNSSGNDVLTFSNGGELKLFSNGSSANAVSLVPSSSNAHRLRLNRSTNTSVRAGLESAEIRIKTGSVSTENFLEVDSWNTSDGGLFIINNDGNVGIGKTNPGYPLDVTGSGRFSDNVIVGTGDWIGLNDAHKITFYKGSANVLDILEYGDITFTTGSTPTEKVRITSSGNVGIGTATPSAKLEVYGDSPTLRIQEDTNASYYLSLQVNTSASDKVNFVGPFGQTFFEYGLSGSTSGLAFTTGAGVDAGERLRIDDDGNVGIGTTSPGDKLTISGGNITLDNNQRIGRNDSNPALWFVNDIATFARGNNSSALSRLKAGSNSSIGSILFDISNANISAIGGSTSTNITWSDRWVASLWGANNKWGLGYFNNDHGPEGPVIFAQVVSGVSSVGIGTNAPSDLLHIAGNTRIEGALKDSANSAGTSGYVLSSTGTGIAWIDAGDFSSDIWGIASNVLHPVNGTYDLAIGGNSTASAKFHVDANTGNTSVSGKLGVGTLSPQGAIHANTTTGLAFVMTGEGFDGDGGDTDDGAAFVLSRNLTGNRQFSIGSTETGLSVRFNGTTLDGYNYLTDTKQDLTIGTDTTKVLFPSITRFTGPVSQTATGGDRIDIGVQAGTPRMIFENAGENIWQMDNYDGVFRWFIPGQEQMRLVSTANAARVELRYGGNTNALINTNGSSYLNGGNVGIGTASPSDKLHVAGSVRITGALKDSSNSAGTAGYVLTSTGNGIEWVDISTLGGSGGESSVWTSSGGVISPHNLTQDFILGANATASAKFQVSGVNGDTFVAGKLGLGTTDGGGVLSIRKNNSTEEYAIKIAGVMDGSEAVSFPIEKDSAVIDFYMPGISPYTRYLDIRARGRGDGSNGDSAIRFYTSSKANDASEQEQVRISGTGNVGIGAKTFGTNAARVLAIAGSTAPGTALTDGIQLWAEDDAGSHELRVMDEAGNVTTLSPHNFSLLGERSEELAWSFYSERNSLAINADMTKALRLVERLSGEKLLVLKDLNTGEMIEDEEDATRRAELAAEGSIGRLARWNYRVWTMLGEAVFEKPVQFLASIRVHGPAWFGSRVTYADRDRAGWAVIPAGGRSVEIVFERRYAQKPVVTITPENWSGEFQIEESSTQGFTITVPEVLTQEVTFHWSAVSVEGAKTVRGAVEAVPTPSPTVSPTPTPDVSPTPAPEASPTPSAEPAASPTPVGDEDPDETLPETATESATLEE